MAEATAGDKFALQPSERVVDGVRYVLVDGGWKAAGPAVPPVAQAIAALQQSRADIEAAEAALEEARRAIASGPADVARANELKGQIESKAGDLEGSAARTAEAQVRVNALRARKAQLEAQGR